MRLWPVLLLACALAACADVSGAKPSLANERSPSQRSERDAAAPTDSEVEPSGSTAPRDTPTDPRPREPHVASPADAATDLSCGTYNGPVGSANPRQEGSFFTFTYGALSRQYKVYVPSGYRNDTPLPVLYVLHGYPGDAELVAFTGTDLDAKAEKEGFLLVVPSGYDSSWNAGSCCGTAAEQGIDDVGFLREVQRRLSSDLGLCIDPSRTYATGYSNGAFLLYRLACEASDLFAALAGVGGKMLIDPSECATSFGRAVPLLEIHGTNDLVAHLEDARTSIESIAQLSGCSEEPVPASVPHAELDTSCETFPSCNDGAEVTLCQSEKKGHCWYGSKTCGSGKPISGLLVQSARGIDANTAVWSFVSRFQCESCARAQGF